MYVEVSIWMVKDCWRHKWQYHNRET